MNNDESAIQTTFQIHTAMRPKNIVLMSFDRFRIPKLQSSAWFFKTSAWRGFLCAIEVGTSGAFVNICVQLLSKALVTL